MCFAPLGVHFFNSWTSKSAPRMVCFLIFRLRNVLRATAAYTFPTFQLTKVLQSRGVFSIWLGHAFRATTVCTFTTSQVPVDVKTRFPPQRRAIFWFLIRLDGSAPAPLSSLLFNLPKPPNIGKSQCFATFLFFTLHLFFFYTSFGESSSTGHSGSVLPGGQQAPALCQGSCSILHTLCPPRCLRCLCPIRIKAFRPMVNTCQGNSVTRVMTLSGQICLWNKICVHLLRKRNSGGWDLR